MKASLFVVMAAAAFSFSAAVGSTSRRIVVTVIGDSITEGGGCPDAGTYSEELQSMLG
jgi:hypothetical protein